MKPPRFFYFLFFCFFTSSHFLAAQVQKVDRIALLPGQGLMLYTNEGQVTLRPHGEKAIVVTYDLNAEPNPPSWSTLPFPEIAPGRFDESDDQLIWETGAWTVTIDKSPLSIDYRYREASVFAKAMQMIRTDSTFGFECQTQPGHIWMGGGERALPMDRTGRRLTLYNTPSYGYGTERDLMYYSLPIAFSEQKSAIIFDNTAKGYLDIGHTTTNTLRFEAIGGRKSYIVLAGDNWYDFTQQLTAVTGRYPMPPRWTFGNIASRFGYHSQREAQKVVDLYGEKDVPLDAIVFDLYWFGKEIQGTLGNFDWFRDSFPEPEGMMQAFAQKNIKTILITEPFILEKTRTYPEALKQGLVGTDADGQPFHFDFYFGRGTLLDVFSPKTSEWFWRIYKDLTLQGVDGWWGDLGEPEAHPDDLLHVNGRADHVHNAYGHAWAKVVADGFRRDFPDRRLMLLMRAGFVGSQRYGMVPWTGDVNRNWDGFKPQVNIALQMGLQGLAYIHSDLGGFAGANRDPELYRRWLQYGVFQPVFRPHAHEDVPSEPIFWDPNTLDNVREHIKLRYQLLPYNYTLAYENHQYGWPLMRPLVFAEDRPELLHNDSSFLWGDAFLVTPITEPQAGTWPIYLPEGSFWIDFFNGNTFPGGQQIAYEVSPDYTPVFVKAGAFIPMTPPISNTEAFSGRNIELHYYDHPDVETGKGFWYHDDGKATNPIETKAYALYEFSAKRGATKLEITIHPDQSPGLGIHPLQTLELIIHNQQVRQPRLRVNGKKARYTWNGNQLVIPLDIGDRPVVISVGR